MNRPLSRRRHIDNDQEWSENINNFLNTSTSFENNNESHYANPSEYNNSNRIHVKKIKRSNYEVAKKAFLTAQRHQATMYKRYQTQMEKTDALIAKGKPPSCIQKQYDFVHVPINQVDNHGIEKIISKRNKEYTKSSKTLPKGYVVDLKTYHSLPPDRHFFVQERPRVFYWG